MKPDFERKINIQSLKEDIEHWDMLFSSPEKKRWWNKFLDGLQKVKDDPEAQLQYLQEDVRIWEIDHIPQQPAAPVQDDDPAVPQQLQEMLDAETTEHTVSQTMSFLSFLSRQKNDGGKIICRVKNNVTAV